MCKQMMQKFCLSLLTANRMNFLTEKKKNTATVVTLCSFGMGKNGGKKSVLIATNSTQNLVADYIEQSHTVLQKL